jgi:ketosteroid isomerase-like protein
MKSSKIALLALFPLLTPATLFAQADERTTIWESLREADVRLAESSRTLGFNQAFLNSFSDGAVIFRRGPVDARNLYEQTGPAQRGESTLESKANYIDFSVAGDLGLTSGPYRFTNGTGSEARRTYGHFVTIWRKFDGQWRMAADMTVRVPGVLSLDVNADIAETLQSLDETAAAIADGSTLDSLVEADERFISSINFRGGMRAMLRYGLANQRVYVPGMAPGIGIEAGAQVYGAYLDDSLEMAALQHQAGGYFLSESRDAGYTFGTMSAQGSDFNTNYLRYWRFTPEGEWRIAVEVLNPY